MELNYDINSFKAVQMEFLLKIFLTSLSRLQSENAGLHDFFNVILNSSKLLHILSQTNENGCMILINLQNGMKRSISRLNKILVYNIKIHGTLMRQHFALMWEESK